MLVTRFFKIAILLFSTSVTVAAFLVAFRGQLSANIPAPGVWPALLAHVASDQNSGRVLVFSASRNCVARL